MSEEQIQDRVEIFDFGEGAYTDVGLVFLLLKIIMDSSGGSGSD